VQVQVKGPFEGLQKPGDTLLDIEVRTQSEVKVIKLKGRLSLGEPLDRVTETLKDLLNAGQIYFLLDLQEVPAIDSSGIGLLVRYLTAAKQRGGSLKLLNPSKFAVQTLKLVRVLSLFEVFEDPQQAVASFGLGTAEAQA
jgi:anti-sigma B factor antagonist